MEQKIDSRQYIENNRVLTPVGEWDNKFGLINTPRHEFDDLEDNYTQRMKEQDEAKVVINGIGKDAKVVTNSKGGKQSKAPIAMHLIDPNFLTDWFQDHDDNTRDFFDCISTYMLYGDKQEIIMALACLKKENQQEDEIIVKIAEVLQEGAEKYQPNNWRLIPQEEHLNHALIHYMAYLLGDTQDNHLEHCMCRLMMVYAMKKSEGFSYTEYVKKTS